MVLFQGYDNEGRAKVLRTDAFGALVISGTPSAPSPSPSPTVTTTVPPIGSPFTYNAIALGNAAVPNALTVPSTATMAMVQAIESIYYAIGNPVVDPSDVDFILNAGEIVQISSLEALQAFRARSQTATAARVRIQFFGAIGAVSSGAPMGSPFTYSAIALNPPTGQATALTVPASAGSAMIQAIEPIYYTIGDPAVNPTDVDFQLGAGEQILLSPIAAAQAFRAKSQNATTAARVRVQFLGA